MKTHTPGPWQLEIGNDKCFHDGNRCAITVSGDDGGGEPWTVTVAEVWRTSNDDDISDARLIAAAPDLLAELKSVTDYLEQLTMYERIDFGSNDGDLVAVNDRILMNAVAAIRRAEKGNA